MDANPPGVKTFVDALAALVPAEVLVAHGVILASATQLVPGSDGKATTTITEPGVLRGAFWALALLAILAYVAGRIVGARAKNTTVKWDWGDLLRGAIPALAFIGWTMLQSPTAFDALGLAWSQALRTTVAVLGGVALGILAALLAYQLDQK
jgi:hypothetical protein